jgi:hypothetical protein
LQVSLAGKQLLERKKQTLDLLLNATCEVTQTSMHLKRVATLLQQLALPCREHFALPRDYNLDMQKRQFFQPVLEAFCSATRADICPTQSHASAANDT